MNKIGVATQVLLSAGT